MCQDASSVFGHYVFTGGKLKSWKIRTAKVLKICRCCVWSVDCIVTIPGLLKYFKCDFQNDIENVAFQLFLTKIWYGTLDIPTWSELLKDDVCINFIPPFYSLPCLLLKNVYFSYIKMNSFSTKEQKPPKLPFLFWWQSHLHS